MIIFILLIVVIIGLITFYVWKTGILKKEHLKDVEHLLDEISARDDKVREYEKTIINKKTKLEEESNEIFNLTNENKELKEKLSSTIKEFNSKFDDITLQLETKNNLLIKESKKTIDLENKLIEKEHQRRANASTVGAKQAKINKLEGKIKSLKQQLNESDMLVGSVLKDLDIANKKMQFYKSKLPEPTLEELKAYDYQFKEVEKRKKK